MNEKEKPITYISAFGVMGERVVEIRSEINRHFRIPGMPLLNAGEVDPPFWWEEEQPCKT